jgi:hypothetical protein
LQGLNIRAKVAHLASCIIDPFHTSSEFIRKNHPPRP